MSIDEVIECLKHSFFLSSLECLSKYSNWSLPAACQIFLPFVAVVVFPFTRLDSLQKILKF